MSTYELIITVPVRVRVQDVANVQSAFNQVSPKLQEWSVAASGGKHTGHPVLLLTAEKVQ
jgi:hypothetical protein